MKTSKLIALIAVAALTGTAAFAGDLVSTSVTNAKGQSIVLYRDSDTAVAVYSGGRGAASISEGVLTSTTVPNAKGQAITLYRAE